MYRIRVIVYLDEKSLAIQKRVLERIVDVAAIDAINFPGIIHALHFLYGDRAIIHININLL